MYARLKFFAGVTIASLAATVAQAADYAPQPVYVPQPVPVIEEFSGWYLRGDIGMSNQQVNRLDNAVGLGPISSSYGFDSAPIFGIGFGYYFNDWLRFDVTGEYRGRANFHGSEIFNTGGNNFTDEYNGSKSEWLFLANAYVDLGTWNNITPFVGAGVGMSRIALYNFQDACHNCGGTLNATGISFAENTTKWNFAWALHAGLAYKVSKNFTVELAYRYVDLGKATTGNWIAFDGSQNLGGSTFNRITSHDVKLGLRFNLDGFEMFSRPAPVYYAPPPVYAPPPPVYVQPPLHSRG